MRVVGQHWSWRLPVRFAIQYGRGRRRFHRSCMFVHGRGCFMRGGRFRVEQCRGGFLLGEGRDLVLGHIVGAAATEHERVHAHTQMMTVRVDTLPDKHAPPLHTVHRAGLGVDLET